MIEKEYYKLKIVFETPVLGAQSRPDVMTDYVSKKNGFEMGEDEAQMLADVALNTTSFHRDLDGEPVLMPHQLKGFLKEAASVLNGKTSAKVRNLRHKVRAYVFVMGNVLKLYPPKGSSEKLSFLLDSLERPLRRETAFGPRATLARSEMLPAGIWFECNIEVYPSEVSEDLLRDILDYGFSAGIGQWRDGGFGRFRYELRKE